MSTIGRAVLAAGAASAVGDVIECSGIAHIQLFMKVTVTAATLQGVVAFGATPDGTGDLSTSAAAPEILLANNVTAVTTLPATFTQNATLASWTLNNPAIGTTLFAVRITNPPQYVVPRFTYTSGGGTVSVQVFAYGFNVKT
jgi:hypothetical protein